VSPLTCPNHRGALETKGVGKGVGTPVASQRAAARQADRRRTPRGTPRCTADQPAQPAAAGTFSTYCNIIEAPWLVNGGHGASLRHHTLRICLPAISAPPCRAAVVHTLLAASQLPSSRLPRRHWPWAPACGDRVSARGEKALETGVGGVGRGEGCTDTSGAVCAPLTAQAAPVRRRRRRARRRRRRRRRRFMPRCAGQLRPTAHRGLRPAPAAAAGRDRAALAWHGHHGGQHT
jgi:hypothetical protein